jgi:ribosome modulation factor
MCNAYSPFVDGLAAYVIGQIREACPLQLDESERDNWFTGWDFGRRNLVLEIHRWA